MTQDELNHIYTDICVHGKHVEGWSCDLNGSGHVLKDNKRQNVWQRATADGTWMEGAKPSA